MRRFFALSFIGKRRKDVVFASLLYALLLVAVRILTSLLSGIASFPEAVDVALNLAWQIVRLYCFAGIAVAVLYATDCLEKKDETDGSKK